MDNANYMQREAANPQGGGSRRLNNKRHQPTDEEKVAYAQQSVFRRIPPHSEDAEQAVLAGILTMPSVMNEVVDIVCEEDFYIPAHRVLFRCFKKLYSENQPIDLVTAFEWLTTNNLMEDAGGDIYLASLSGIVSSAVHAEHWANIVKNKSMLRQLITTSAEIITNCYESPSDPKDIIDESEKAIFAVSERSTSKTYISTEDLVDVMMSQYQEKMNAKGGKTGVTTGYIGLDNMTYGLQKTDLIIVAARPSMGKTAFVLNLALHAAIEENRKVIIFSLEMSRESLMDRLYSVCSRVPLSKIRKGDISPMDWQKIGQAGDNLRKTQIFIDDTSGLTPLAMRARCRRIMAEHGLDLVIVDYLQLMKSPGAGSRELEVSDISRNLKALAKELQVPVVALAQLNRNVDSREEKIPVLSDLRESGAIEQDADVIMFIHREDMYHKKKADYVPDNKAQIIIGKHRNGPTGTVTLRYASECTAFDNFESGYLGSESAPEGEFKMIESGMEQETNG